MSTVTYECIVHIPRENDYHYIIFEGIQDLVFACFFTKQYNTPKKVEFCVFKVDVAELAPYVVGKKEGGKGPLSKFEGIEMKMVVFPEKIKYELFTYAYFSRQGGSFDEFFRSFQFVSVFGVLGVVLTFLSVAGLLARSEGWITPRNRLRLGKFYPGFRIF